MGLAMYKRPAPEDSPFEVKQALRSDRQEDRRNRRCNWRVCHVRYLPAHAQRVVESGVSKFR